MLNAIYLILFFSLFVLYFFNELKLRTIKIFALRSSGARLILISWMASKLPAPYSFQADLLRLGLNNLNSNGFGFGEIHVLFIFLCIFLIFICIFFIRKNPTFKKQAINLFLVELSGLVFFSAPEPIILRFFFDFVLIFFLVIKVRSERQPESKTAWLLCYFLYIQILNFLL